MKKTVADGAMQGDTVSSVNIAGENVVLSSEEAARARKRSVRIANELRRQMLRSLNRQLLLLKCEKLIYRLRHLGRMRFVVFRFFRFELPILLFSFIVRITSKRGDMVVDTHGNAPLVNAAETPNV